MRDNTKPKYILRKVNGLWQWYFCTISGLLCLFGYASSFCSLALKKSSYFHNTIIVVIAFLDKMHFLSFV
jgi:hypothetical protein